jgi:hypothetical protein
VDVRIDELVLEGLGEADVAAFRAALAAGLEGASLRAGEIGSLDAGEATGGVEAGAAVARAVRGEARA